PLVQMDALDRVLALDADRGIVEVEAGIQWPALIAALETSHWGIVQKQTGADRLSIGGALAANIHWRGLTRPPFVADVESFTLVAARETSHWGIVQKLPGADRRSIGGALAANIHGRGLTRPPFVADVESFTLVAPDGSIVECSRTRNPELFALAIGGYGLFGVVATVRLRLTPRIKIERVVEVIDIDTLPARIEGRVADGYLYGDGQFDINPEAGGFLRRCVFSSYRPAAPNAEIPLDQK